MSCVARLAQRGQRFGAAYLIEILRGAESQKLIDRGHQQLSVYGIGKARTQDEWRVLVRALLHQGLLEETNDGYPVLRLTESSRALLKAERRLLIAVPPKRERVNGRGGRARKPGAAASEGTPLEVELFERLRALRKQLADEQKLPPYVVFADAALRAMAARRPTNRAEFAEIPGVGSHKLERYSAAFTQEIRAFRAQHE